MADWNPISDQDFAKLFDEQYAELDQSQRASFERFRVRPWKATIHRFDEAETEFVYVVAQSKDGVLYFDDVEYGFNISAIDSSGTILQPGGNQNTLREAIVQWFPDTPTDLED